MLTACQKTYVAVVIVVFLNTASTALQSAVFTASQSNAGSRKRFCTTSANISQESSSLFSTSVLYSLQIKEENVFQKSLQNDDELSQAVNEDEDTLHPQPTKQAKSNDLPPGTLDSFSRSFKTGRRLTCVEIVRTGLPDNRQIIRPCSVREAAFWFWFRGAYRSLQTCTWNSVNCSVKMNSERFSIAHC